MSTAREALSWATRAAGAVIALGYLLGLVPGPLTAVGAATGAVAFGHALMAERGRATQIAVAWGAIALALVVAGLRWGTVSLDEVRGAQAVLGPTLLVSPDEAAIGAWLTAAGGALAGAVLLSSARPAGWRGWSIVVGEGLVLALALVTAFWGEALVGIGEADFVADLGVWAAAVAAVLVVGGGLRWVLIRLSVAWAWVATIAALAATAAGSVLVSSVVGL